MAAQLRLVAASPAMLRAAVALAIFPVTQGAMGPLAVFCFLTHRKDGQCWLYL